MFNKINTNDKDKWKVILYLIKHYAKTSYLIINISLVNLIVSLKTFSWNQTYILAMLRTVKFIWIEY